MSSDHHEEKPFTKLDHFRQRGDDLLKIELYSISKQAYLQALALKPGDEYILGQLQIVKGLLKAERNRIFIILGVFAAIALLAVLIF